MAIQLGFGTWRFFLAFLVAISHLYADMLGGPAAYAVWGFYVLSGYLMTKILIYKYGFEREGLKAYAHNRFLRIYPLYFIATLMGIATLVIVGNEMGYDLRLLNPEFGIPSGTKNILFTITLLPIFAHDSMPVAVASALGIEVGVYFLMPLIARHKGTAWVALIISLVANINYGFGTETFAIRYSTFTTCLVAFVTGSLVVHYRDKLNRFRAPLPSVALWIAQCLIWYEFSSYPWKYGLYVSVLLSAWVIISLDKKTGSFDKFLGDLSYPTYLIHTIVAAWFIPHYGFDRSFIHHHPGGIPHPSLSHRQTYPKQEDHHQKGHAMRVYETNLRIGATYFSVIIKSAIEIRSLLGKTLGGDADDRMEP